MRDEVAKRKSESEATTTKRLRSCLDTPPEDFMEEPNTLEVPSDGAEVSLYELDGSLDFDVQLAMSLQLEEGMDEDDADDEQPLSPVIETAADAAASGFIPARRLATRTPATSTVHSNTPLITASDLRKHNAIVNEKAKVKKSITKQSNASAVAAIRANPVLSHGDLIAGGIVTADLAPHVTHDIRHMASRPVMYCNNCGKWAQENSHSQLQMPCLDILRGYKHVLRLLQNDVLPGPGPKIPAAAKQKPGRKRA